MARAPSKFRQRDVTRMVAGLVAAGVDVREVVVDMDGRIKIIAGRPGPLGGCLVSRLDDPYPAELGELLRSA